MVLFLFSCTERLDKEPAKGVVPATDTVPSPSRREHKSTYSTQVIAVKPIDTTYSADFSEFMSIAKQMNYTTRAEIRRVDSIDFHCWKRGAESDWIGRLVYSRITTHCIGLKEITSAKVKKGMYLEEAIFPSEKEAITAGQKIQDFIFQDSSTNAYDKRPTDIFRYKNRIYQLSAGDFSSIPDMKIVCRRFRKELGPETAKIMLWDYYGYGE